MPSGKPAGVRCIQLDAQQRCRLFGQPTRPAVCRSLTPEPDMCRHDAAAAIAWLTAGVAQAGREVSDPFLKTLAKPEKVSFKQLESKFSQGTRVRTQSKQKLVQQLAQWKLSLGYLSLEEAFKPKKQSDESSDQS